jgi:hypothetical protein
LGSLDAGKLKGFKPLTASMRNRLDKLPLGHNHPGRREVEKLLDELKFLDEWGRDHAVKARTMLDLIDSGMAGMRPLTSKSAA